MNPFRLLLIGIALVMGMNSHGAPPVAEPEKPLFRFVQMSDSHGMFTNELDKSHHDFGGRVYSRSFEILEGALAFNQKELMPRFIVHTGDFVENGGAPSGLETMQRVKALAAGTKLPFFPCFGNHEWNDDSFERVFGLADYRYNYGNLIFIHLKASHRYPKAAADNAIPRYVLYQLDDYLSNCGGNVVIALHEPLVCHELEQKWARPSNYELVIKILERHPNVIMVIQGHTHFFYRERRNNIDYIICPGLVNSNKHPDEQIDGKTPDTTMGHYLLAYDVYPDCIKGRLYGASSTEDAIKGDFRETDKVNFSVPLKEKMRLSKDPEKDLWVRSLPSAKDRYDPAIEAMVPAPVPEAK